MKYFISVITLLLSFNSQAAPVPIKLSDVTERVSNENFNVYENALKVYECPWVIGLSVKR